MLRLQMILARFDGGAYRMARAFGRGRAFSAYLQARFCATGRTGRYRVKVTN